MKRNIFSNNNNNPGSARTPSCLDNPGPDYSQHFFTFGRARPTGRKVVESPDLLSSGERRRRRREEGETVEQGLAWSPPDTQQTNPEPFSSSLGKEKTKDLPAQS